MAAVSTELVFTSKKKKDKPAKGLSEKELEDMEKLKQNIMTKKSELKAEGMSRAARPFSAERSCWLRRRELESACCTREDCQTRFAAQPIVDGRYIFGFCAASANFGKQSIKTA